MQCITVAHPSSLPLPRDYDVLRSGMHSAGEAPAAEQQLLDQLQAYIYQAQRLLNLTSIEGAAQHALELESLFAGALTCIKQSVQTAAAAKQPLLTVSSQHARCFCRLLEQLQLLDAISQQRAADGGCQLLQLQQQQQQNQQQQRMTEQQADGAVPAASESAPPAAAAPGRRFIDDLEQLLWAVPGADAVYAALITYCQQNVEAGCKRSAGASSAAAAAAVPAKQAEVIEVSSLASSQELHSAARALPILLRLYFTSDSRAEALAQGKPEPLSNKLLERCLLLLAAKPVVPGHADTAVCVVECLAGCRDLQEVLAARKLKLPAGVQQLDDKAQAKLNQVFSLQPKVLPLLQQHDELCDLVSQLALEVKQAVAVDRDIDDSAFEKAEQVLVGGFSFAASAKNSLLELDAWRLACRAAAEGPKPTAATDRYSMSEGDAAAFMHVLGALKGAASLLADSSPWLQPLLQEHAVKQLQEFALTGLPGLAKAFPRNQRVRELLQDIYAVLQGQLVELRDYAGPAAAAAATTTAATADASTAAAGEQQAAGPVAEGFESLTSPLKAIWGKRSAAPAAAGCSDGGGAPSAYQAEAAAVQAAMLAAAADAAAIAAEAEATVAAAVDEQQGGSEGGASAVVAVSRPGSAAGGKPKWSVKSLMPGMGSRKLKAPASPAAGDKQQQQQRQEAAEAGNSCQLAPGAQVGLLLQRRLAALSDDDPLQLPGSSSAGGSGLGSTVDLAAFEQPPDLAWEAAEEAGDELLLAPQGSGRVPAAAAAIESRIEAEKSSRLSSSRLPSASVTPRQRDGIAAGSPMRRAAVSTEHPWASRAAGDGGDESGAEAGADEVVAAEEAPAGDEQPLARVSLGSSRGSSVQAAEDAAGLSCPEVAEGDVQLQLPADESGVPALVPPASPSAKKLFQFKRLLQPQPHAAAATANEPAAAGVAEPAEEDRKPAAGFLHRLQAAAQGQQEASHAAAEADHNAGLGFLARLKSMAHTQQHQQQQKPQQETSDEQAPAAQPEPTAASAPPAAGFKMKSVLSMLHKTSAAGSSAAAAAALVAAADAIPAVHAEAPADADAAASPRVSCDVADVPSATLGTSDAGDQRARAGRTGSIMSRVMSFRPQLAQPRELSGHASEESEPATSGGGTPRQAFKGLSLTARLKKAMTDKAKTDLGFDGQGLVLSAMPTAACLVQLRVLLEQLLAEIKRETKKHLVMQLQMAAAAAAGSAGAKPDASIARPLKQVKSMIRAVHAMQLMPGYQEQLMALSDLSGLWLSPSYCSWFGAAAAVTSGGGAALSALSAGGASSLRSTDPGSLQPPLQPTDYKLLYNLLYEEDGSQDSLNSSPELSAEPSACSEQQQPAGEALLDQEPAQQPDTEQQEEQQADGAAVAWRSSFPAALLAACMRHLDSMPAELPLLALQLLWDARSLLRSCGLLKLGLPLLRLQEESCMQCYMQELVPAVFEHYKKIAAHQTITQELLQSCGACALQLVQPLYLEALLRAPCPLLLLGDYSSAAAAVRAELQGGSLILRSHQKQLQQQAAAAAAGARQEQALGQLQAALTQMQQQLRLKLELEPGEPEEELHLLHDDQQGEAVCATTGKIAQQQHSNSSSPTKGSPTKGKRSSRHRRRTVADQAAAAEAAAAAAEAPGQTPLMLKLEQSREMQAVLQARQQQALAEVVQAYGSALVDLRQWLVAGLVAALRRDAANVVQRCRSLPPSSIVAASVHATVLQRTHQLLSQYAVLPVTWSELWAAVDADGGTGGAGSCGLDCELAEPADTSSGSSSVVAQAVVSGILAMLDTAAYDSEAQVLLAAPGAAALASAAEDEGALQFGGVLGEVSTALAPLRGFFGWQHLVALHGLTGPAGRQLLLSRLLHRMEEGQAELLDHLLELQQQLPASLQQLPPAEECHTAAAVLGFYQQSLSPVLSEPGLCAGALHSLQCIGNGMALLQLMSVQQSAEATPTFMQVAPLLGIVGQPVTEAAAAAECFECEGGTEPPSAAPGGCSWSCAPGLLMPEIEALEPSERARKAHEMQVQREAQQEQAWRKEAKELGQAFDDSLIKPGGDLARHRMWQASHFQQLLLGPDADKVRGPALLLAQTAELRAWQATQGLDLMGPCMERVKRWAGELQQQLVSGRAGKQAAAAGGQQAAAGQHKQTKQVAQAHNEPQAAVTGAAQQQPQQQQQVAGATVQQVPHDNSGADWAAACSLPSACEAAGAMREAQPSQSSSDSFVWYGEDGDCQTTPAKLRLESREPSPAGHAASSAAHHALAATAAPGASSSSSLEPQQQELAGGDADAPQADAASAAAAAEREASEAAEMAALLAESSSGVWGGAAAAGGSLASPQASERRLAAQGSAAMPEHAAADTPAELSPEVSSSEPGASSEEEDEQPDGEADACSESDADASTAAAAAASTGRIKVPRLGLEALASAAGAAGAAAGAASATASGALTAVPSTAETSAATTGTPNSPRMGTAATSESGLRTVYESGQSDFSNSSSDEPEGEEAAPHPSSNPSSNPSNPSSSRSRQRDEPAGSQAGEPQAHGQAEQQEEGQVEGQYGAAPPLGDLLFESTCHELVRVKDERDLLKSEVVLLRSQLENRDTSLALLSGNFWTPRLRGEEDADAGQQQLPAPLQAAGDTADMQPEISAGAGSLADAGQLAESLPLLQQVQQGGSPVQDDVSEPAVTGGASEALSLEASDIKPDASKIAQKSDSDNSCSSSEAGDRHGSSSGSSSAASSSAGEHSDHCAPQAASRKLRLPAAVRAAGTEPPRLAIALSALKFGLLMQVARGSSSESPAAAAAAAGPAAGGAAPASPLKRLRKAALSTTSTSSAAAAAAAAGDAELPGGAAAQEAAGSGRVAGGLYGDGPLLASAVLLQLAGQARRHSLLDATSRIAHWVECDAVRQCQHPAGAGASAAGADSSTGGGSGTLAGVGAAAPGGIGAAAAGGVAPPKPRSKKRQEEDAEQTARAAAAAAAQAGLLQRLAAASRQADRVAADGLGIAARFAAPAPARQQTVQLRVYRADRSGACGNAAAAAAGGSGAWGDAAAAADVGLRSAAALAAESAASSGASSCGSSAAGCWPGGGGSRVPQSSLGGMSGSSGGAAAPCAAGAGRVRVAAVPVRPQLLAFGPRAKPWAGITPSQRPIQGHPALPMKRPLPGLLPSGLGSPGVAGGAGAAAAAGQGVVGPAGKLLPGVGVTARAGVVAAARAVHAREAVLACAPTRAAAYSLSVVSDHNRSGLQEDGYSRAPSSSADPLDAGPEDIFHSPRKGRAAAAAARLGGRRLTGSEVPQDWSAGASEGEASPRKSPVRSPRKRQQAAAAGGPGAASFALMRG